MSETPARKITKKYSNGEVTVVWQPHICVHSTVCFRGLPAVFDPGRRPWVDPLAASTAEITAQVDQCPSGALTWFRNSEAAEAGKAPEVTADTIVEVSPKGPLLVYGNLTIKDAAGNETKKHKVTAFCRCGTSQNKPYCDGGHKKVGFEG